MGNIQAQIKIEIHNLFKAGSQAEFSTKIQRILNMELSLDELQDCVAPQQVRDCIEDHFDYFSFLFQYLVDLIRDTSDTIRNLKMEHVGQIRNAMMLLSKFISTLYEQKYSAQCFNLLWRTSNTKMTINEKKFKQQRVTMIKVNDETMDNEEVNQMIKPNILVLVDALLKLCFFPNFTVLSLNEQTSFNLENDQKLKSFLKYIWVRYGYRVDLKLIWRGFGEFVKYPNDQKIFIENRIIILQCLVACFGSPLFRPRSYTLVGNTAHTSPLIIQSNNQGDLQEVIKTEDNINEGDTPSNQKQNSKEFSNQVYLTQNCALICFISLNTGPLKELLVSLWATILYHKYSFFWFQDNALLVKRHPRILAGLSAQSLLFILTEVPDFDQIGKQIEFNVELREVYQYIFDINEDEQLKLKNIREKDENQEESKSIKTFEIRPTRKSITTREKITDCLQIFTNAIREIICNVDSQEFFEKTIERMLDNISAPFYQESNLISTRSFDMSGITETLGLLLFILRNNRNCVDTIMQFDAAQIKQIISILLYQQVKFAEGQITHSAYLLCIEIITLLSRHEKYGIIMTEPMSFSIAFTKVPTITGSYGDFIMTFYSYLIYLDFQQKMQLFNEKGNDHQKTLQEELKADSLSLILFQISPHIRQLSEQAAFYLSQAFFGYISYEFLLQKIQHAHTFQKFIFIVNNILCFDLVGNCTLIMELVKRQIELQSLIKFKVGKSQLMHFYGKHSQQVLVNQPSSCLPTEKSELISEKQQPLQPIPIVSFQVPRRETENQEEEQKSYFNNSQQPDEKFQLYYSEWVPLLNAKVFSLPPLERLKQFLIQFCNLAKTENYNFYGISKHQTEKIINSQVWFGLMDRSLIILSLSITEPSQRDHMHEFQNFVLRNALSAQEWFPRFDQIKCLEYHK